MKNFPHFWLVILFACLEEFLLEIQIFSVLQQIFCRPFKQDGILLLVIPFFLETCFAFLKLGFGCGKYNLLDPKKSPLPLAFHSIKITCQAS